MYYVGTMVPKLQNRFKNLRAYIMIEKLKEMFQDQARHEKIEFVKSLLGESFKRKDMLVPKF